MKNNKDQNKVFFGPQYKDLETQTRRNNRESNYEKFETDLRLDLAGIPEIQPGPEPFFPIEGQLPPPPGVLQTESAGVITRDTYVDFEGVLGYGPGVVLDYNTTDAMFADAIGGLTGWPTVSCPGGALTCNTSNNAYGILRVRNFSGTVLQTLSGFNSRSFAVVNGTIYAVSYNSLRYWDGSSWVIIPPPVQSGDSTASWYSVFTYDESTGRHYLLLYKANLDSSLSFFLRIGAILPNGSVQWGSRTGIARNLAGPTGTTVRTSPASTNHFNGRAKYGRAYFTFGTAPRWMEWGVSFNEETLAPSGSHRFVSSAGLTVPFGDLPQNNERAYTLADIDVYGRMVIPSRYNPNSTTTYHHGPDDNNIFTVHNLTDFTRSARVWLPSSFPSDITRDRPVQVFAPFDDRVFVLGRSTAGVPTIWETRIPPDIPLVGNAAIQANTKILWDDPTDGAFYTFGCTPSPEWPFYTFGTVGGVRLGLFPP
jgi:hypothetical protein